LSAERLYLGEHSTLNAAASSATSASDSYTVDLTASTGKQTRWHTGFGGGDVVYPDRADEDKKLLVYTSAPLETDLEITGTPVLTLEMSSTTGDGALHAYLEDVSPQERVTYVDEGIIRVIDRKQVDPKSLPYKPPQCGRFIGRHGGRRSLSCPSDARNNKRCSYFGAWKSPV
jgi:uncharacterized protein